MWDSEDEQFKKTRKRRLKKLGIKVKSIKRKAHGEEEWEIDKSGYKRKQGYFKKKSKRVSYTEAKAKPKKRGRKGKSNLKRLLRGEL